MKEMFEPEFYRNLPVPGDLTLAECKAYMVTTDHIKELLGAVATERKWKEAVASIHFLEHDHKTECPDAMTHDEWKKLNGFITIDIGEGGARTKPKVPELV